MDQASSYQVVDQLAEMLAARRRSRADRRAAYVALARAILADDTEAGNIDQAGIAA